MALSDPPALAWPGRYSDGRTAALHWIEARIGEEGLLIATQSGAPYATWPLDALRLIDGPDSAGWIKLGRFGSDARLTLQHRDALRALEPRCPRLHDGMTRESPWRVIALWCGAAAAAIAFLLFGFVPFMARHASQWVSPRLEAELGDRLAGFITTFSVAAQDKDYPECDAPAGRAALDALSAPLAAQLDLRNSVHIRVINSRLVNALALPGDQILIFRGLIDFVAGPNELAGVIAHEMGHLKLDHPLILIIEQSGTAFVVGLMLGDIFGGSALAIAGTGLVDTAYSREAEAAADAQAVMLMQGAGYDVAPFGAFFKRLGDKRLDGDLPIAFLRTHPPTEERARLIAAAPAGGRQALTRVQWHDLKSICADAASAKTKATP